MTTCGSCSASVTRASSRLDSDSRGDRDRSAVEVDVTTVAHWGTFEVANLGDLLFPLVLEHHLRAAGR